MNSVSPLTLRSAEMSSDNFTSDAFEGAAKGALDWTAEKISSLVKKFREGKLAFIKEHKTIEIAREQYHSGEAKFYENYVKDKETLFLLRMGLALRKLENDAERRDNLREKIFRKFKVQGLHIAEFVENGMLNRYIGLLLENIDSVEDIEKNIQEILRDIDKHAIFVGTGDVRSNILKSATIKVGSHSPSIFVVAGMGFAAKVVGDCIKELIVIMKDYEFEKVSSPNREILFFRRKLSKMQ